MSTQNESSKKSVIPRTSITIYGGRRDEVSASAKRLLDISDDEYYSTWINLGIMKRLGFLFEGGVESAGGLGEIVCMFAVVIIILAMFTLWNVAVVFLVVAVLTILSGGAAIKFLRAVYVTAPLSVLDTNQVDEFVQEQVSLGRFVRIEGTHASKNMSKLTQRTSAATLTFRTGIQFALLVASVFLIIQVIYYFMMNHWLSGLNEATRVLEIQILTYFGLLFLFGVILMDVGVLMRSRAAKSLKA
ncbi:hypothetical protein EU527_14225 [Candidatus Thorarchaeota archaeon]|nr:MAG: hypothetical protein EU527_14225 [Candidatus Thorarchaeota archaeon]